jgi:hypothetical protein
MNTWLFRADPSKYELANEIRKGRRDYWELKQHRDEVKKDDMAIFWQLGEERGVYGLGKLEEKKDDYHIYIRYTQLLKHPVLEKDLLKYPLLRRLLVLRRPRGRDPYSVSKDEWQALKKLFVKDTREEPFEVQNRPIKTLARMDRTDVFSPDGMKDARKRQLAQIVVRQGQGQFRERVLAAYGRRCAVTGCDVGEALEAAHIVPYLGPKTNPLTNGLLLRADVHTLFDLGLMAVDPTNFFVIVSKTLQESCYRSFDGKPIRLPKSKSGNPSVPALKRAFKKFRLEESKR